MKYDPTRYRWRFAMVSALTVEELQQALCRMIEATGADLGYDWTDEEIAVYRGEREGKRAGTCPHCGADITGIDDNGIHPCPTPKMDAKGGHTYVSYLWTRHGTIEIHQPVGGIR